MAERILNVQFRRTGDSARSILSSKSRPEVA